MVPNKSLFLALGMSSSDYLWINFSFCTIVAAETFPIPLPYPPPNRSTHRHMYIHNTAGEITVLPGFCQCHEPTVNVF